MEYRNYKSLPAITGFFVAVLLISNVASTKLVNLGHFTFDGGTLLFPISYIFGDILTEVYGFRIARRTIWIGLAAQLMAVSLFAVVGMLPSASEWTNQAAYESILLSTTRIVMASVAAYLFGSWSNDTIMSIMKRFQPKKHLWMRTIGSTVVGEALDTGLFCMIAFAGTISSELLWTIILSNYIFKVGVEVFATPVTYLACNTLKRIDQCDVVDTHRDYNPFSWRIGQTDAIPQTD